MPWMESTGKIRHLPLEKLRVARLVAEGYRQREVAAWTGYAPASVKVVVAELADDLAGRDADEPPSVAVRDWWREHRVEVALDVLEALGVTLEELVATRGDGGRR